MSKHSRTLEEYRLQRGKCRESLDEVRAEKKCSSVNNSTDLTGGYVVSQLFMNEIMRLTNQRRVERRVQRAHTHTHRVRKGGRGREGKEWN